MMNLIPATLAQVLLIFGQVPQDQASVPQQEVKPRSLKERGKEANDAYKRGDFQLAADAFKAIVQEDPEYQAAWMGLATSLRGLDRLDEAAEAFSKAAALGGDSGASSRCLLAVLLMKKRDSDGALRELAKALTEATDGFRPTLAEAAREDPDLKPLRNNPRFRELVGLPLDVAMLSPARNAAYRFLEACGSPFDVGLRWEGEVLLYLDRADYRSPGAPFLLRAEGSPSLPANAAVSIDQARTYCKDHLSLLDTAPAQWSKARLCGQLFGYPVGVMNSDRLFIYFYESGRVAFIEQRIVSILDLLLKQKAGSQAIPLEQLRLDSTDVLDQLKTSARPADTIMGQFDVLFGYDPFAALAADASNALHAKGMIRDPRTFITAQSDRTKGYTFFNPLFRVKGSPSPGVVQMSWPPSVNAAGLASVEKAARAVLAEMRETEVVFISLFEGLTVADHEASIPDDSAQFWRFFLVKDWSWWEQPRLVALLSGKQLDPAVVAAFRLHAQLNTPTADFGGAWKEYFDRLNRQLRLKMDRALDELAIAQEVLDQVSAEDATPHPDFPNDPVRLANELTLARLALKYDLVPLAEQELPARLAQYRYFESAPTLLLAHEDKPEQPRFLQFDASGAGTNVYQIRYGTISQTGARTFSPWVYWYGGQGGGGYGPQGEGRKLELSISAGPCLRMNDVRQFARTARESMDGWNFSLYLVQGSGEPMLRGFAHSQWHAGDMDPSSKSPFVIALRVVPKLDTSRDK